VILERSSIVQLYLHEGYPVTVNMPSGIIQFNQPIGGKKWTVN